MQAGAITHFINEFSPFAIPNHTFSSLSVSLRNAPYKVGKNPGFMSIAQPSGFYWENPGFTRVILGFTGFTG